jgi:cysteine desulfurase
MNKVYLDNASATKVDERVFEKMSQYCVEEYGNPSSIHSFGLSAKKALEKAREEISVFINAHPREIIFTSGGTEANNLAIFGVYKAMKHFDKEISELHFVTTEIEHSSITSCLKEIENEGSKVDYVDVDKEGIVNLSQFKEKLSKNTVLVSIGYANSEIGVIQPIKEIMKIVRYVRKENNSKFPYVHLDASQATQFLNVNVEELGIDLMTIDGQKMYGPKGVGALYIRDGIAISPITFGGGQEKGLKPGTENLPAIVGLAEAVKIAFLERSNESKRLAEIRDYFFNHLKEFVPNAIINGHLTERLPNNINISIPGKDGEFMVLQLDERGFICSTRSACESSSESSFVIKALLDGPEYEEENRSISSLRFTLGKDTQLSDIKSLLNTLSQIV